MSIKIESCPAALPLVDAINNSRWAGDPVAGDPVAGDPVALWWLGQAGFAVRYRDTLLLIDPYLSDSLAEKYRGQEFPHTRMMPAPVDPASVCGCGWYLCTHGHTDHMDGQTITAVLKTNSPQFVIPRAELERGLQRGIPEDHVHLVNAGEVLHLADSLSLEAVAAAHEELETDAAGNHKFLGYVLTFGDTRIYHSGDNVPYPGLAEHLAERKIDLALLPINGRDEVRRSRGVPGNFKLEEAIALCHAAHIRHLLGHHFGLFDFNTIDPADAAAILEQGAGDLEWVLPQVGLTYLVQPA